MEIGTIEIDAVAHTVTAQVPLPRGAALPLYGLRIGRLVAVERGDGGVTFTYSAEPGRPPRFHPFAELRDPAPLALPVL